MIERRAKVSQPVLFLIIHGVQFEHLSEGYAADFIDKLESKLPDTTNIVIRSVNWARLVEGRQKKLYASLAKSHNFWLRPILKLMAFILTDVLWYLLVMVGHDRSVLEAQIDAMVKAEIDVFRANHPDGLVVIGGHSLGSQIGLKLCYDTLDIHGLITWGTFCQYLSDAYPDGGHPPAIKFWLNFYNPADPVSTIMKDNPNFKDIVTVIPVHNYWRLTPIRAHTMFWTSDKMISAIAEKLQKL